MENWELDFNWLRIQHYIKDSMKAGELPDLRSILLMIGIQELGDVRSNYSKEEKQDLMHIAVCTLLEEEGFFRFVGRDQDNWPHWENTQLMHVEGIDAQEVLLKQKVIIYFDNREKELEYIRNTN